MVLSILSYFDYDDARLHTLAAHLLEQQMPDWGGIAVVHAAQLTLRSTLKNGNCELLHAIIGHDSMMPCRKSIQRGRGASGSN